MGNDTSEVGSECNFDGSSDVGGDDGESEESLVTRFPCIRAEMEDDERKENE